MEETKEWYEKAAAEENQWVRAVILKNNHILHGHAFEVADRACKMAEEALGEDHPAYAVALQNLGLYYNVVKNDVTAAIDCFDKARAIVGRYHPALAESFYWLGIFHYESRNVEKVEDFFSEALAIQRHSQGSDRLELARTLICLAYAKEITRGSRAAVGLMEEALAIQRASLPADSEELHNTEQALNSMHRRAEYTTAEKGRGIHAAGAKRD
jgi:tetratricopeptide (TPR) repeat protein